MSLSTRLSQDLMTLKSHYTVLVVGSGYGAGVAASRLARAGQSVCVLERGRELRPGEYPNDLASAQGSMQLDTSRGKIGAADGLFNVHINPDMTALVGCGLGGTSLINANVALEIDPRLFEQEHWPEEFRSNTALLEAAYERARRMLDVSPYPTSFPILNKLSALEQSAKAMKQPFYRPPIAVNFVDQTNAFGVSQPKCVGCGDCCSGCNFGAKNTTLMNYLPDAVNHGAQIVTQARVERLERDGDVWRVYVAPNGATAKGTPTSVTADIVMLGAGALGSTEILLRSAQQGLALSGRLGQRFSGNGDVLAFGYDCYWKAAKGEDGKDVQLNINGVGIGSNKVAVDQYPGPCITGVIDMRLNSRDPNQGLVIEEGVIPGAMATGLAPGFFFGDALAGNFFQYGVEQAQTRLLDAKALGEAFQNDPGSLTEKAYLGPVARTQTYLVMSVDEAAGQLELQDDRLRIVWPGAGESPVIARDNELIKAANDAIQGQFFPNPIWTGAMGQHLVTVHPVGGCGMGDHAQHGAINHKCQVFAGASGTDVHRGLYVCDGAAMPGPVGVNPLLTISAVAERACELLALERGWNIDWTINPPGELTAPPPASPRSTAPAGRDAAIVKHRSLLERIESSLGDVFSKVGHAVAGELSDTFGSLVHHLEDGAIDLAKDAISKVIHLHPDLLSPKFSFTETMHGHVSLQPVASPAPSGQRISDDFEVATAWGRALGTEMHFELTIASDDMNHVISDPTHPAAITGSLTCPGLQAAPMVVRTGEFHLLPVDESKVETWLMTYDMVLGRTSGGPVKFHGYKVLHQRTTSNVWADVTTLFVTVHEGEDGQGPMLAQGTLTLNLEDLMWQGSTVQAPVQDDWAGHLVDRFPMARNAIAKVYLAKFAGFFGMTLFKAYGGILANMNNFPALELAAQSSLRPTRKMRLPEPQVEFIDLPGGFRNRLTRYQGGHKGPVLVAPGFSIRASSFAINTVDENLAEFLVARGYDVWLFDYRASPDSGCPSDPVLPFTIDDIALIDWPHAVARVRERTGAASVQAVSHCISSMSLLMGLASGDISGVRSLVSSQLTLHPVTDWFNYLKADMNVVGLLEGVSELNGAFDFSPIGSDFDHKIDAVAWQLPVPEGQDCKNPTCRRVFAVYGPSYNHDKLNHWTHTTLSEIFGRVSIKPFEQLQTIMQLGYVVDAQGHNRYLTEEAANRLALPISFIAGAANQLFYPETSLRTLDWLRERNDPKLYTRHQFAGYAHMDTFIGRDAAKDIYPYLVGELDRYN